MDLIVTNAERVDLGALSAYALDLSFGAEENDFELILGATEPALEYGAFLYIEGTEYGGRIGGKKSSTNSETVTYTGRTWHGIMNGKIIQPDAGASYYTVSGDAHDILRTLLDRLGLSGLFSVASGASGVNVSAYKFARYCKAYDGVGAMLASVGAKLKIAWVDMAVQLSVEPITDHTNDPVDGDTAALTVERHEEKVNHLICLGRGELAAREVIHLYVNQYGKIVNTQYYTGLDEIVDTYENTNAESSEELRSEGVTRLKELRDIDKSDVSLLDNSAAVYDIGDIVGATDYSSGLSARATVTQKIVKINNGRVDIEHKIRS